MTRRKVPAHSDHPHKNLSRRAILKGGLSVGAFIATVSQVAGIAWASDADRFYSLTVQEHDGRQRYNHKTLGPVMRVRPGETLDVELINDLSPLHDDCTDNPNQPHGLNTTNLHTHGLHVSPTTDSSGTFDADNVFVSVVPNGQMIPCEEVCGVDVKSSFRYGRNRFRFELPPDHNSGTFWYHAHKHGSTANQVNDGLAGPLIVEDRPGSLPNYIEIAPEKILFITNEGIILVDEEGGGEQNPTIEMRPGEVQRWRVINGTGNGTDFAFVRPSVANLEMHLIAFDGLTQNSRVRVNYDNLEEPWLNPSALASGNRADFIVRAPESPLTHDNEDNILSRLFNRLAGSNLSRLIDLSVKVSGEPLDAEWTADAALPGPGLRSFDDTDIPKRELSFTRNRTINLTSFTGEVEQTMTLNTAEEWIVRNNTQVLHVYHIHVNPFFVTSVNGEILPQNSPLRRWQDTIGVPLGGRIGFKTRFETYTGKFVIHCHVLPHEDSGMMQVVEVIA